MVVTLISGQVMAISFLDILPGVFSIRALIRSASGIQKHSTSAANPLRGRIFLLFYSKLPVVPYYDIVSFVDGDGAVIGEDGQHC